MTKRAALFALASCIISKTIATSTSSSSTTRRSLSFFSQQLSSFVTSRRMSTSFSTTTSTTASEFEADQQGFLLAAIQMTSTNDKAKNLRMTTALVERACAGGAKFICLPECSAFMGSPTSETATTAPSSSGNLPQFMDIHGNPTRVVDAAESIHDGSYVHALQHLAKANGIFLSVGGFPEVSDVTTKVFNTHFLINPTGDIIDPMYRKIHLFDNPLTGLVESKTTMPGKDLCVVDLGIARVGLTVCYDLRFPELYGSLCRRLDDGSKDCGLGAEICLVPSAFTVPTGEAHWLTLLRARAIENQVYVIAAAQVGQHNEKRSSWGETVIIDPWGRVLAKAPTIHEHNQRLQNKETACVFLKETIPTIAANTTEEDEGGKAFSSSRNGDVIHTQEGTICFAVFDRSLLCKTRAGMPVESHRRSDLYYPSKL